MVYFWNDFWILLKVLVIYGYIVLFVVKSLLFMMKWDCVCDVGLLNLKLRIVENIGNNW